MGRWMDGWISKVLTWNLKLLLLVSGGFGWFTEEEEVKVSLLGICRFN